MCVSALFQKLQFLSEELNHFLEGLKDRDRKIFILRYWYMLSVREVAAETCVSENQVIPGKYEEKRKSSWKKYSSVAAAVLAVVILGGSSAYAYRWITNRTEVNQEELPSIGELICVENININEIDTDKIYPDYNSLIKSLDFELAKSTLSESNPYMQVRVQSEPGTGDTISDTFRTFRFSSGFFCRYLDSNSP